MTQLTVYSLKNCDSCRSAIAALKKAGFDLNIIDVRAHGINSTQIDDIITRFGWEKALNRRSTTWRKLGETDKGNVSPASAQALILAHPTLLKRPVIIGSGKATIGWGPAQHAVWL